MFHLPRALQKMLAFMDKNQILVYIPEFSMTG